MNLQQVRYFLALCEEQHFSRAARRCGVSQPSLTNAIRALEDELGGRLFHRKPRIRTTPLGRLLRPHFKSVVQAVDRARKVAARANGHGAGATAERRTAPAVLIQPVRRMRRPARNNPGECDGGGRASA
jgi:DNA-binding transcriptional LysR family regulator